MVDFAKTAVDTLVDTSSVIIAGGGSAVLSDFLGSKAIEGMKAKNGAAPTVTVDGQAEPNTVPSLLVKAGLVQLLPGIILTSVGHMLKDGTGFQGYGRSLVLNAGRGAQVAAGITSVRYVRRTMAAKKSGGASRRVGPSYAHGFPAPAPFGFGHAQVPLRPGVTVPSAGLPAL